MAVPGQCFICAITMLSDHGRMVHARTASPIWTKEVACAVCAKKVADQGEALIYRQDEWVTVRIAVEERAGSARLGGTLSP